MHAVFVDGAMKPARHGGLGTAGAIRVAFALCGAVFAVGAVAACGQTASSSDRLSGAEVVRVGRHSITKATLEHWTAVEGVLTYQYPLGRSAPKGLAPDPPDYAGCIAYSATNAKTKHARPTPTTAQLKARCKQEYEAVQRHMLDILITNYWVSEEAATKGLKVTAKEVQRALDRQFQTRAKFRKFLAITGERPADQWSIIEHKLLLEKLQWSVSPLRGHVGPESEQMANQVDLSIAKLGDDMKKKWTPQTNCRAGYVVSECRQYRDPQTGAGRV
jgi:hypothetical protein